MWLPCLPSMLPGRWVWDDMKLTRGMGAVVSSRSHWRWERAAASRVGWPMGWAARSANPPYKPEHGVIVDRLRALSICPHNVYLSKRLGSRFSSSYKGPREFNGTAIRDVEWCHAKFENTALYSSIRAMFMQWDEVDCVCLCVYEVRWSCIYMFVRVWSEM